MFSEIKQHLIALKPFALVTAWTDNSPAQKNREQAIYLVEDLRLRGLGGTVIRTKYREPETDDTITEISFFVRCDGDDVVEFRQKILELDRKYHQNSVLISDGKEVVELMPGGTDKRRFTAAYVTVTDLKDLLSLVRGHNFQTIESGFRVDISWVMAGYHSDGFRSDMLRWRDFANGYGGRNIASVSDYETRCAQGEYCEDD